MTKFRFEDLEIRVSLKKGIKGDVHQIVEELDGHTSQSHHHSVEDFS